MKKEDEEKENAPLHWQIRYSYCLVHPFHRDRVTMLPKSIHSSIPESQRGPGYCKFNSSFINATNFVDSNVGTLNELINKLKSVSNVLSPVL